MLCKYYWIVLYTVHVTAFCLGGPFFSGHGVLSYIIIIPRTLIYFPSTIQHPAAGMTAQRCWRQHRTLTERFAAETMLTHPTPA